MTLRAVLAGRRVALNLFRGVDAEEILGLVAPVTTLPKGDSDVQSNW
jgi:hypothetical protein